MTSKVTMIDITRRAAALFSPGLIALLFAMPVFADFRIVELAPPPPAPAPAVPKSDAPAGYIPLDGGDAAAAGATSGSFGLVAVSFVGTPPSVIEDRQGMGRDVRLADALRQIAPAGWRGFVKPEFAPKFDRDKRVNWRGGRRWVDVLDIVANESDIAIEVNWERKQLYIGERRAAGAAAVSGAAGARTPVSAAPPPPPPVERWSAVKGSTLRQSMSAWASKASCTSASARAAGQMNWTLAWPSSGLDYRIAAPLTFEGSIADAAKNAIRLYEHADEPLGLNVHPGQCVLHVFAATRH